MGTSFAITALCVAVWVFSNQWMGEGYSSEAISIWNTFIQLATFSIFAILLNELKNTISHKKALVYTDSLTGLNNRREFCRYLQMEIYRAQRYNSPFAVAYIDINSFKLINDKLGHAAGDYLLHYIGQSMKNSLRKTDFVARTGGDEFAVLFPEIDEKGAQCAMGKLREYLANKMTQDQTSVTFSMALAHFPVAPHYSAEELIKKAEQLMLQAKMQRKDGVVFKQME
jgi:diguanylate cyclase (GGDEF)-like protein